MKFSYLVIVLISTIIVMLINKNEIEIPQIFEQKTIVQTEPIENVPPTLQDNSPELIEQVEISNIAPLQKISLRTPPNVSNNSKGSCNLVNNYDWNKNIAYAVCMAESGGNPLAKNLTDNHMSWAGCMGSFGLFQINCSHGQLYDPVKNVAVAYQMYQSSGWQPWSAYNNGVYLKYMR